MKIRSWFLSGAVLWAAAAPGDNLLRNPEFRGDNLGGLLNWNIEGVADVRKGAGPAGENVLHFTKSNGRSLAQMDFLLAAGEDYRFGAWVRTKNVPKARLLVYNAAWDDSANVYLPADTHGEWKELQWQGKIFASKNGHYYFRLWCDAPLADGAEIELAAPYVEPLSAAAEKGAEPTVLDTPRKVRVIPINPLLSEMDATAAKMEFYYPGDLEKDPSAYSFAARLDGGKAVAVTLDGRCRGTVSFGAVTPGRHRLSVRLFDRATREVIAGNEYPVEAKVPFAGDRGRALNNFVTELKRVSVADGEEVAFDNPRDGWVYIGFGDPKTRGEVFLDGAAEPVVTPREHESCDTLRFLTAGRHVAKVGNGDGTLVVHAVKLNFMAAGGDLSEASTIDRYQYGLDFRRRYFFNRFARYDDFNWTRGSAEQRRWSGIYERHGAVYGGEARLGADAANWGRPEKLLSVITNSAPYRDGLPVSLDESSPVATRLNHATLADAAWMLADAVQPIGIWWNNCLRNVCSDPRGQATELAAIANSGRGRGLLLPEVYVIAYPDKARLQAQEDHFVNFLSSIREQVPAATGSFILAMGGYTMPKGWCAWIAPETDLKVLYDDFVHRIATDPACRDIGGIGYTAIPSCDEEILRWFCRLVRHYAIEGRTDKLAPKFGFTYLTDTVRNNDFTEGLAHWTALPAEAGSIAVTNVSGFGTNLQGRKMVDRGFGDDLVVFTRSAKRPNRLVQKVTGLKVGRLYALGCASVDVDDYAKPIPRGDEVVFRLSCGAGGEVIPELCYDVSGVLDRRRDCRGPWSKTPVTQRMLHRIVFRATASETEISFSDWASDREPGGTIGARRMFNHVNLRLYYVEDEDELEDLKRIFPASRRDTALDAPPWPVVKPEFYDAASDPTFCPGKPAFAARFISSKDDTGKGGVRTFRLSRKFELRERPAEAWLQAIGDDSGKFFLNGTAVAGAAYSRSVRTPWSRPDVREITRSLRAGTNEIAAEYTTRRDFPGGVLAELFVRYADGTFERIETDGTWEGAVASDPPPAPNRWRKVPYRDFATPQKSLGGEVENREVVAGMPMRIRCAFEGPAPTEDFTALVTLTRGGTEFWRKEVSAGPVNAKEVASGRWRLALDVEAPLYFNSGAFDLAVESDAICLRGAENAVPCGSVAIRRAAAIPGFERPVESCVKTVAGSPEVFVNGKPFFLLWGATFPPRRPGVETRVGDLPLTAVKVVSDCVYWNPAPGKYDFTFFDREAELARRSNPDAYFIWDLNVYPSRPWGDAHREELATDDTGEITGDHWHEEWSYPSRAAKDELKAMVGEAIRYLESSPYANRILGYRVTSGYTIEWLGWKPKPGRALDFSKPAQEGFRAFAAANYPELADATVPSLAERGAGKDILWNPRQNLKAVAYMEYYSRAVADCALELCGHAKEALGGRKIVGTYYGYTMYLNASGCDQMRAHFALGHLLRENGGRIDYLMSPQCYGWRRLGDSCLEMKPFASLAANGILSVIEDDTRTHARPEPVCSRYFQGAITEKQSVAMMRRNLSIALCHRSPAYCYALDNGTEFDFPAMSELGATIRTVGEHCVAKGVRRQAEVAVVVSEKAVTHAPAITRWAPSGDRRQRYRPDGTVETERENGALQASQVFGANLNRFARAGAPVDYLLAEDLPRHAGDYRLYVFENALVWDDALLKAVEAIRARGAAILWLHAPGYVRGLDAAAANMKALTGIDFAPAERPLVAGVTMAADGRFMGTPEAEVAPMFVPTHPDETLGTYADGTPGLVRVRTGASQSYFSGTWQLDVPFLLDLYRRTGVHVYCDTTDPIEANGRLFTLHARFPGRKTVTLPRASTVLDVFNRRIVARNTKTFSFPAELHSTHLFYFGDDADDLLKEL